MAEVHNLLNTDASNTDRWPEGMAPSSVNNAGRAMEGYLARYFFDQQGPSMPQATLSGSVIQVTINRVSITMTGTTSNYIPWLICGFVMGNSVPGPCSLRINDIQTLSLRDNRGVSLSSTAIPAGSINFVVKDHDNNYFRLLNNTPDETGTWTPQIAFGGASVGVTSSVAIGRYKKQGNRVYFYCNFVTSAKGSSTGAVTITGLPYTSDATANRIGSVSVWATNLSGITGHLQAYVNSNSTTIPISYLGTGTATDLADTNCTDTSQFIISGHYETAT